jgi:hypothetical protein
MFFWWFRIASLSSDWSWLSSRVISSQRLCSLLFWSSHGNSKRDYVSWWQCSLLFLPIMCCSCYLRKERICFSYCSSSNHVFSLEDDWLITSFRFEVASGVLRIFIQVRPVSLFSIFRIPPSCTLTPTTLWRSSRTPPCSAQLTWLSTVSRFTTSCSCHRRTPTFTGP